MVVANILVHVNEGVSHMSGARLGAHKISLFYLYHHPEMLVISPAEVLPRII